MCAVSVAAEIYICKDTDLFDMIRNSIDEMYMRRCLQLAECGRSGARPNPMVGAVIVARDRIIGEGYHVCCGQGHAEVNAFASVRECDLWLLPEATMYVSLEPCAHYGRTPPCADLIVSKGVRRVVVGCTDPFARVCGRGIQKLKNAGIEVTTGVLERECISLNSAFFTFNTLKRPFITLKWAQTANGYIDDNYRPMAISTPFTKMLSHKLRAESDAILVGRVTAERDNPRLNVREWSGRDPLKIVVDREHPAFDELDFDKPVVPQLLDCLYLQGIQSLIVEGGAFTLNAFIAAGAWDRIRVETAPVCVTAGTVAPSVPAGVSVADRREYDGNTIITYERCREVATD